MWFAKNILFFQILGFLIFNGHYDCQAFPRHDFVVRDVPYTRLCSTKKILTVNGQFPGPILRVHKGDTIIVSVYNRANYNITLHWHGVKQPRNPWTDGPEYITQCPIKPGGNFNQKIIFSTEEGTIWWHAHSDWSRATVHGAIIVYPKVGTTYPFPKPYLEFPIILGEWWKKDVNEILEETLKTGGDFNVSDAFTINGQPGDLYPCSKSETFKLTIFHGKTYLLRIVNAGLSNILFFGITKHNLTVVGVDGSYTKPLTREFIVISPGQTIDALLHANQQPNSYYMAAKAYSSGSGVSFDNTTTTAILNYYGHSTTPSNNSSLSLPYLPYYNDTTASVNFSASLRSLADKNHPINVPLSITTRIISTISVNKQPCPANSTCDGPNGTRLAASMNNISFSSPSIDILEAYYKRINGVFGDRFPSFPPFLFNFTGDNIPSILEIASKGTEVKVLNYNSTVEIVFQGTNLVAGIDHPMHLHGYSFYVIGFGLGNFDINKDPLKYNLIDPPLRNTVAVPKNGWTTIRFKASNPGVWFMHCHLDRHLSWGMETVFIVKNGERPEARLLPPPPDMPPC